MTFYKRLEVGARVPEDTFYLYVVDGGDVQVESDGGALWDVKDLPAGKELYPPVGHRWERLVRATAVVVAVAHKQ